MQPLVTDLRSQSARTQHRFKFQTPIARPDPLGQSDPFFLFLDSLSGSSNLAQESKRQDAGPVTMRLFGFLLVFSLPAPMHAKSSAAQAMPAHTFTSLPRHTALKRQPLAALTSLLIIVGSAGSEAAHAQSNFPAPSRTTFKCEVDGRVSYSDSPCLGAKKVELEPTRGLNSSTASASPISGAPPLGADVQRERRREAMVEALRPATGMNAKQFDTTGRRLTQLSPEVRQACERLDRAIPLAEEAEAGASKAALPAAQEQLLQLRRKFRELRC